VSFWPSCIREIRRGCSTHRSIDLIRIVRGDLFLSLCPSSVCSCKSCVCVCVYGRRKGRVTCEDRLLRRGGGPIKISNVFIPRRACVRACVCTQRRARAFVSSPPQRQGQSVKAISQEMTRRRRRSRNRRLRTLRPPGDGDGVGGG